MVRVYVVAVQTRDDGIDKVKSMLREGFDRTIFPIKSARGTGQTGMTSCGACACGYDADKNESVDHVNGR